METTKRFSGKILAFLKASIIVLAFLGSIPSAFADANVGMAFLAAKNKRFPCDQLLEFYKGAPHPYLAILEGSFGSSSRCVRKFLKASKSRPHTLQYYISNEVCRRKGNCERRGSYELMGSYSVSQYNKALEQKNRKVVKAVKKRAKKILRECRRNGSPNTKCLLAIGLESQFSERAAKALVQIAMSAGWQSEQIVHNPVHMAPYHGYAGAYYYESHGVRHTKPTKDPSRNIVTLDGDDPSFCNKGRPGISNQVSFSDLQRWTERHRKRTAYIAYWCSVHQGIVGDSGTSPKPHLRTPRVDSGDIAPLRQLAGFSEAPEPQEYNTKQCQKVFNPGGGFIWKNSDHHGEAGSPHQGMVVIFPSKFPKEFKRVDVVSPDGKRSKLKYTGKANGGRQHWRDNHRLIGGFSDYSVVKAYHKRRKAYCWRIQKAGERND